MSTKLTGYVWDGCAASGMKLSSVAIMARLADFSNDEGVCWPSIETIARQIGAGMSTVRTAIARLEAEGWLTRKARRQGTDAVNAPEWRYYWQVNMPAATNTTWMTCGDPCDSALRIWGDTVVECVLNKLCPSHTYVIFKYPE